MKFSMQDYEFAFHKIIKNKLYNFHRFLLVKENLNCINTEIDKNVDRISLPISKFPRKSPHSPHAGIANAAKTFDKIESACSLGSHGSEPSTPEIPLPKGFRLVLFMIEAVMMTYRSLVLATFKTAP